MFLNPCMDDLNLTANPRATWTFVQCDFAKIMKIWQQGNISYLKPMGDLNLMHKSTSSA